MLSFVQNLHVLKTESLLLKMILAQIWQICVSFVPLSYTTITLQNVFDFNTHFVNTLILMDISWRPVCAVSYTHLDVYKRQVTRAQQSGSYMRAQS